MSLAITVQVQDSSGASVTASATAVQASASPDGSAGAPSGPPQYPSLLNSYGANRPPWKVAGVDYAVGIDRSLYPTNAALKNPATISMAGVTVNATSHEVTITGSNVVIDGYDFSLNGGWWLNISSGSNITVSNNNFAISTNSISYLILNYPNAANVTITKNNIDGAGKGGQGLISSNSPGITTITYNSVMNAGAEPIVIATAAGAAPTQDWIIQYNVIGNGGMAFASGAHGDWIQAYNGANAVTRSLNCNYNTLIQTVTISGNNSARTQGLSLWSAGGNAGSVVNMNIENNTLLGTSGPPNGAYVNFLIIAIPKNCQQNINVLNNYFDPTVNGTGVSGFGGAWGDFSDAFGSGGPAGFEATINGLTPAAWKATGASGPLTGGNINMLTGKGPTAAQTGI